jgi:hypothetical protein
MHWTEVSTEAELPTPEAAHKVQNAAAKIVSLGALLRALLRNPAAPASGGMFWFFRKKLSGLYCASLSHGEKRLSQVGATPTAE